MGKYNQLTKHGMFIRVFRQWIKVAPSWPSCPSRAASINTKSTIPEFLGNTHILLCIIGQQVPKNWTILIWRQALRPGSTQNLQSLGLDNSQSIRNFLKLRIHRVLLQGYISSNNLEKDDFGQPSFLWFMLTPEM